MFKLKKKNLRNDKKGATLIEMLLVIAIIGILVALLVPNFSKAQLSAKATAHNANVKTIESAVAMYMIDNPNFHDGVLNVTELEKYLDKEIILDEAVASVADMDNYSITVNKGVIEVLPGEVGVVNGEITLK